MVGQRFVQLLENHPWFEVAVVAASPRSKGKTYTDAVEGRWAMSTQIPHATGALMVMAVEEDLSEIAEQVDFVFSAIDLDKNEIKRIEELYAAKGLGVVSNNSAHRWTPDVPMILPEVNPEHLDLIQAQRKNRGWDTGFIVVKPNCSIQCYVPPLHALRQYGLNHVIVSTYQAISGAGKTIEMWPEMNDNVIPYIGGEEEKSEKEPLKAWGEICEDQLKLATQPTISATCIRVPVSDGHMASVSVSFEQKPSREEMIDAWKHFDNPLTGFDLPSAPQEFLKYYSEDNRPQTGIDRDRDHGMGISIGRLREDTVLDWKFVALSHNTIRGAAGGAILTAELLKAKGYL